MENCKKRLFKVSYKLSYEDLNAWSNLKTIQQLFKKGADYGFTKTKFKKNFYHLALVFFLFFDCSVNCLICLESRFKGWNIVNYKVTTFTAWKVPYSDFFWSVFFRIQTEYKIYFENFTAFYGVTFFEIKILPELELTAKCTK